MPEIAYVNDAFVPLDQATIHVEDRGVQFADAVYEVLRTAGGRIFALEDHLERLFRSLQAIELRHEFTRAQLAGLFQEAVRRAAFPEAVLYVQISRGRAPRHRKIPAQSAPNLILTVRPLPVTAAHLAGLALLTVPDGRWARCDIKSVALLANVLAYHQARQTGAHDAIFVGADGWVAETTAGNIFLVERREVRTPPVGPRILAGVTRAKVLQLAATLGIPAREQACAQPDLYRADELFITSTTAGVVSVASVDGKRIGSEPTGPVTRRLAEALDRLMREA